MQKSFILLVDSIINFLIGLLLLFFPRVIIEFLGIPMVENAFYPSVLGSILMGIGIALFFEWRREKTDVIGLGIGGAIIINVSVGLAIIVWLLFGNLAIPLRGYLILWGLALIIIVVVILEIKGVLKLRFHNRASFKDEY